MAHSPIANPYDMPNGMTSKQHAWDRYGLSAQQRIAECPESYILKLLPYQDELWNTSLIESLGSLNGKLVLELGCGLGRFSTYIAKEQGSKVFGIDLAFEAIKAASQISCINSVNCQFCRGNVSKLPFTNNSFDVVVGIAMLHHLSKPDVVITLNETHRVLKEAGKAIFVEPVENSKVFNFIQNLFPAGEKQSEDYRPSCLSRKAWDRYLTELEDRAMTNRELLHAAAKFRTVFLKPFGLFSRLDRFCKNKRLREVLELCDLYVLNFCPPARRFSRNVLVECEK